MADNGNNASEDGKKGGSTHFKITADDIYALLVKRHSEKPGQYAYAGEVCDQTGWANRRLDFVAVACWPSDGFKVNAFEIKISKSDLRRELEHPEKHNIFFEDIDTYSLAAPDYVIDMSVIPKKWGVYAVVMENGKFVLKCKRKPLALHDDKNGEATMRKKFAVSLIRACMENNASKLSMREVLRQEFERGRKEEREEFERMHGKHRYVRQELVDDYEWMRQLLWGLSIHRKSDAENMLRDVQLAIDAFDRLKAVGWSFNALLGNIKRLTRGCNELHKAVEDEDFIEDFDKRVKKIDDIEFGKSEPLPVGALIEKAEEFAEDVKKSETDEPKDEKKNEDKEDGADDDSGEAVARRVQSAFGFFPDT